MIKSYKCTFVKHLWHLMWMQLLLAYSSESLSSLWRWISGDTYDSLKSYFTVYVPNMWLTSNDSDCGHERVKSNRVQPLLIPRLQERVVRVREGRGGHIKRSLYSGLTPVPLPQKFMYFVLRRYYIPWHM